RDGAAHPGGRGGARHPDPRRRDLLPAAAGATLAAAHGRLGRPGDRTQAPAAREGRPVVVLRELQPQAVRGILHPARHRAGFPAGVRSLLRLARAPHLRTLRAPESGAGTLRRRGRELTPACSRSTSTPITCRATGPTSRPSTATRASR